MTSYDNQPSKNASAQKLLKHDYIHSGFLRKLNPNKVLTWSSTPRSPSYVILVDGCVYHFDHESSRTAKGAFSLHGYNVITRCRNLESSRQPWVFQIIYSHSGGTTHLFSASSEKDLTYWMKVIREEMLRVNGRKDELNKLRADNLRASGDGEEESTDNIDSPVSDNRRFSNRYSTGSSSNDVGYGSDQCLSQSSGATSPVHTTPTRDLPPNPSSATPSKLTFSANQPSRTNSFLNIIRRRRLSVPKAPPPALPNKDELDEAGFATLRPVQSSQSTPDIHNILRIQPLGESIEELVKPVKPPKPASLSRTALTIPSQPTDQEQANLYTNQSETSSTTESVATSPSTTSTITDADDCPFDQSETSTDQPSFTNRSLLQLPADVIIPDQSQPRIPELLNIALNPLSLASRETYFNLAFMPELDKESAASKLRQIGQEGVFIIRNSDTAFKVLTVFNMGRIRKLKIFEALGDFYFVEADRFHSMDELISYYKTRDIANLGIRLTKPYKTALNDMEGHYDV